MLVLLAGAADGVFRLVFGLGNPVLIMPDRACGYIIRPEQKVFRFFSHTYINREGMRSDEFAAAPNPHTLRIMFVGDSVTYGTGRVDQSEIFTQIVRRRLPSIVHQSVEVLNASASAWAPDNELSYVRSRGIFNSSVVLLVINSGDLTQPRATMDQVGNDLLSKRPATAFGEIWDRFVAPRFLRRKRTADAGDSAIDNPEIMRANLADLDSFYNVVTTGGARMVLVYLPFRKDIPVASARSLAPLEAWSAAHNVDLIDLTPAEARYSAHQINEDSGVHLNPVGNQVVAGAILRAWPWRNLTQVSDSVPRTAAGASRGKPA